MIYIDKIQKNYSNKSVLNFEKFVIPKGSIFGLIGPNGAGKTTLLKSILNQISFTGNITIEGIQNIDYMKSNFKKVVYIPETILLYDFLTGSEFLDFILNIRDQMISNRTEKINLLLEMFDLFDSKDKLIVNYSLGMKRKLSLVSALIQSPDLLILDEPISGLDAKSVVVFKKLLRKINTKGCTIFITTHIIDLLSNLCNHIAILHNGKIKYSENKDIINISDIENIYMNIIGNNIDNTIDKYLAINNT